MEKLIINGGNKLSGLIKVSGAKNVAIKVILAGLLTDKPLYVRNIPLISSVYGTADIVRGLGVKVEISSNHSLEIKGESINSFEIPLVAGELRTATMVLGPLLVRFGKAIVPNPGGCRIGKRPIERHIDGLRKMGAEISYKDGFFHAKASCLYGIKYKFAKNTHTGTETLILAAVKAKGETILENASAEPEVDDLIRFLSQMGARIKRVEKRTIVIQGVKSLGGAEYEIMPDRNEVVTFAIGALISGGDIVVEGTQREYLREFLQKLDEAKAGWEPVAIDKTRFYAKKGLISTSVTTSCYPGFMTDWQAPWALLMTQAEGESTVHETIYEDRFNYVNELSKMGAKINFFEPEVKSPSNFYNFNWTIHNKKNFQAIKIKGPSFLHNAILEVNDLRAGATLVLAAIRASGESIIYGIDHIDRGYEKIEERLSSLGAKIKRLKD